MDHKKGSGGDSDVMTSFRVIDSVILNSYNLFSPQSCVENGECVEEIQIPGPRSTVSANRAQFF